MQRAHLWRRRAGSRSNSAPCFVAREHAATGASLPWRACERLATTWFNASGSLALRAPHALFICARARFRFSRMRCLLLNISRLAAISSLVDWRHLFSTLHRDGVRAAVSVVGVRGLTRRRETPVVASNSLQP